MDLDFGSNTLSATVTATDGMTTQTYSIKVTRQKAVATLAASSGHEISEDDTTLSYTVTLSPAIDESVVVNYATKDYQEPNSQDHAYAGQDYTAVSGSLTFAASETSKTFDVPILEDAIDENDEIFFVGISVPANSGNVEVSGNGYVIPLITDDDPEPELSIADASAAEGDPVSFTLSLSEASGRDVQVNYTTSVRNANTATSGTDFTSATAETFTIAPGETSATLSVETVSDSHYEGDETFTVTLGSPVAATLASNPLRATGTITNDDVLEQVTGVTASSGNETLTVDWTAVAGAGGYTLQWKSGTQQYSASASDNRQVTIASGATSHDLTGLTNDTEYSVRVAATRSGVADGAWSTEAKATPRPPNTPATGVPSITGKPYVGVELTAAVDAISDADGTTNADGSLTGYTYQWIRVDSDGVSNATEIGSATGTSYTLTTDDEGKQIKFRVDFTDDREYAESVTSAGYPANGTIGPRQSDDATLSALAISETDGTAITLTPTFAAGVTSYTASVPGDVTRITLSGTLNDDAASLAYDPSTDADGDDVGHQVDLSLGENLLQVNVTAEDGSTQTYSITVTRNLSDDATLSALAITETDGTAIALTPTFAAGVTSYTASVDATILQITLAGTLNDSTASLAYDPSTDANDGIGGHQVDLSAGENDLEVEVTAKDGSTQTYTITVSRTASDVATLSALTISDMDGNAIDLDQAFASGTASYTAEVAANINRITVLGTLSDSTASLAYDPSTDADGETDGHQVDLTYRNNVVRANVTAEDGGTQTYTIRVTRTKPTVAFATQGHQPTEDNTTISFTVMLTPAVDHAVDVNWETYSTPELGIATADEDYEAASGILTFNAGETSKTIEVNILEDTLDEVDENFFLQLTLDPSENANLVGSPWATIFILDDDDPPSISIADAEAVEGNPVEFIVSLSAASGLEVTVDYSTSVKNSDTATSGTDFTAVSSETLTITPEEPTATISIDTAANTAYDADRTFTITLSSPTNASLSANPLTAQGTIRNDELLTQVSDFEVTSGDAALSATWTAVAGAEGYKLQWKSGTQNYSAAASDGRQVAISSGTTTSYELTGLTNDTEYSLRLAATHSIVEDGAWSAEAVATPIEPDTTAPALSTATVNGQTLVLTYDEDLDANSVPAASDFAVTLAGAAVTVNSVNLSGAVLTLTIATAAVHGDLVTLDYTVPASGAIRDGSLNESGALSGQTVRNITPDIAVPTLDSATVNGDALVLTYNEDLDTNSEPAASDFTVTVAGTDVTVSDVEVSGAEVTMTLGTAAEHGDEVSLDYVVPASNPIQDDSGNRAAALTGQAVENLTPDTTAPKLTSATVLGNRLTLFYGEALDTGSVPDKSEFTVTFGTGDDSVVIPLSSVSLSTSGETVSLFLQTEGEPGQEVFLNYSNSVSNPLQDAAGNPVASLVDYQVQNNTPDTTAPSLSTATVNGTSLLLTYDEDLDTDSVPAATDFTVTVAASTATLSSVELSGAVVTLTLATGVENGEAVSLDYTVPASNPIQDDVGNGAAGLTGQTVVNETPPRLSLSLDSITDDNTINIAEKASGFTISGDTGSVGGVSVTVTVGTTDFDATSAEADPATWSVSVPANAVYVTGTSIEVTVSASKTGYISPTDVSSTLTVDLSAPPPPTYTAPGSLQVGVAITTLSPTGGSDVDEYSATGLPAGLSIDAGTGAISGTPDTANASAAEVAVTVADTAGNSDTVGITFPAVAKGDQTLTGFAYSTNSVTYGSAAPMVTAPTGAKTTLGYTATPSTVCTVNASTGALTLDGAGDCVITATAVGTDDYNEATATYTVTVSAVGSLALSLNTIADDDTINIAEKAAGFTISGDTGTEAGVSVSVAIGTGTLTATSSHAAGDVSGTATWSVDVPVNATYITESSVDVTVSASKTGYTSPADVSRSLTVDLTAPVAPTYTAPGSLQVGVAITTMSPTGGSGIDTYSAADLPSGLSIDSGTGAISGTPDAASASGVDATVTASDTAGNADERTISFPAVAKGDQTLTGFSYSASSVTFGSSAPTVTAPSGAQTTLGYSATPDTVCTVNATSGALTLVGVGDCVVTATAVGSDDYNEATASYTVTVSSAGSLVLTLDTIAGDDTINIAEKSDGFTISGDTGNEAGVSVSVKIGTATLTATSADVAGTATWSVAVPQDAAYITETSVEVTVSVGKTGYTAPSDVERTLTVDLTAPTAPSYTLLGSPPQVGKHIVISRVGGTDIDGHAITGLPSGLDFDDNAGDIYGAPNTANANPTTATVTVWDAAGNTDTVDITFPAVAKGDQELTLFSYSSGSVDYGDSAPTLDSPPGGAMTPLGYTAAPATVCTVNASTGALTILDAGVCVITATAAGDSNYNEATVTFNVTVKAIGSLELNLDDIAGDNIINIAEKAAGFTISGDTGTETGVSVSVVIDETTLTATSADVNGTATWSVEVLPHAAYITGTSVDVTLSASKTGYTAPADVVRTLTVDLSTPVVPLYPALSSLKVGEAITDMTPTGAVATDTYAASGLPSGLVMDAGTGVISGTPDTAKDAEVDATVTITDSAGNMSEFTIAFPAVDKGDQTLTGFEYSSAFVDFGEAAPTVTAPSGVQTTLSYSATPDTVCTVDASGALTLVGVGICDITATAAGDGNYNEATATTRVTVTAVGSLALTLDTIAGDDTINIDEKANGFTISGDTGAETGVSVSVEIGDTTLTATSADDNNDGTAEWSVDVSTNSSEITGTSVTVTLSASKAGYTAPSDVSRALTVDLTAPTAPSYTAPLSLKVGVAITMNPTGGTDIDEYAATGLPSGLAIDDSTGAISGTPDTADANTASATVTVSDAAGNTATVDITFPAVAKGDQTLSGFQYSSSSVTFGSAAPTVTAPTGAVTTLDYTASPATVCRVNATTGVLTLVGAGDCVVTATAASNDDYNAATATYTITVQAVGTLTLNVNTIADDDTINIAEKATGFAISGDTGTETDVSVSVEIGSTTFTATSADVAGTATWSVSVPADSTDITGTSVDVTVSASKTGFTAPADVERALTVDLTAPTAPVYWVPSSLKVGVAITAMEPSRGTGIGIDEYAATGLPSGFAIDDGTGAISGTPDTADAAATTATVTVSDTAGNTDTVDITFPAVGKGDQTLTGFAYSPASVDYGSAAPTVTPPTGARATLDYSATPPEVCTVNATSGALTLVGAGDCVVTVTAEGSANYKEATDTFTVEVIALGTLVLSLDGIAGDDTVNVAEHEAGFTISGNTGTETGVSVSVVIGETTLNTTSTDDDSDSTAEWSVDVLADAAYITEPSVGVTVSASKTGYTAPTDVERTLTVDLAAPSAPTYTAPSSLKVGEALAEMSPSGGIGIDEYAATGLPSGLVIDGSTGAISGTPDTADANTATATVTVSDTAGNTATVDITFPAVAKGDQTLSGFEYSASSVTFGAAAPTVTAPTGAATTLGYTASPATVCTVNATTGALTLIGAGDCVVTAIAASTDDYNEATATYTVTVQAVGTLALNVNTIADDDTINIAEKGAGFTISGDTGTETDVSVSVEIGSTTFTATSADVAGTATWSVSVPADSADITGTSVDVNVSATKTGFTAPADVERTLTVDLTAPTAPTYTAPSSLKVGEAIAAMNPSGSIGIDQYSASGLPSGLVIDGSTGAISGTPDTADASTASATVTVSDTAGNSATVDITFPAVAKGDQTLTGFQYNSSSVTFGAAPPTITAPTGAVTTLGYTATPATVCTVDATTGALTLVGAGNCVVTATAASTDDYNQATATYTVTVQAVGTLTLNVNTIADDDTINIAEKGAGFTISGDTGTETDVSVSVEIGSTTFTATSADVAGTATWSVSVPADSADITGTSVDVTVSASKTGFTAPADVERTLVVDLTAPMAPTYTAPSSLKVGEAIAAMNPSGGIGIDQYSASGLPSGLVIDGSTGAISGTPDTADASTASATVTVSDTAGNSATVDITFPAVAKGDQTLTGFQYGASSVTFGAASPTITAPTGAVTTLGYTSTPATVCTVDATTGALTLVGAGDCVVTATAASTDDYNEATATYTVTVQAVGTLALNVDVIATDDTVNIAEKEAGFSISGDTGTETDVSVSVEIGTTTFTATSADVAGTATWSVSVPANSADITGTGVDVTVSASKTGFTAPADVERTLTVDLTAPTAPTYTAPASLKVGEAIAEMSPSGGIGSDEYAATGLPSGLVIDGSTGSISGTPDTADASTASATVTVSDTAGNSATVDITFPAVAKGDQTLSGFQYSAASVVYGSTVPTVTAPTGVQTTLGYSATPATVCTVDATTGALTLIGAGDCVVTATAASTDDYNEATATYTVTVQAVGTLALNVDVIATDDTVNIAEKEAGFSISGDTGTGTDVSVSVEIGTTTFTATSADVAGTATWSVSVPADAAYITGTSVDVTVSASKAGFTAPADVERTLTVDLSAPTAPTYTAPASLKVGEAIAEMSPSGGIGIDEYAATGLPSGLVIDSSTGAFSGTPDTANASTSDATVTVSDAAGNTATADITFPAVAKGDQTLSGFQYSASSVTFGSTTPVVTAPTGVQTVLGYSATPAAVCTVDATTGALTLVGAGDCVVTATAASTDDYNVATATYTVTVQAVGTLALNVDVIATDDTVNIAEKEAGFSISGDTGTETDVSVSVEIGTTTFTSTSADVAGTATWSVSVPANSADITGTGVDVTVSASKTGFTAPADVERTLTVDLTAPTAPTYTAPSSLKVGEAIAAMSPSGGIGIDEYAATGLPSGLVIDGSTGAISGTPDTADANTASATVTVSDAAGNTATVDITFPAVAKGDQTLSEFEYSASSVTFGSVAPTVTAPTGVQTTAGYSATPSTVCTVNATTGVLTLVGAGDCVVTATAASNDDYNAATATYTVTVQAVGTLTLNVNTIADDDTINIAEKATGFSISGDTGTETDVSISVEIGSTTFTATSADVAGTATWSVSVPADSADITGTSVDVTVSASKTGFTAPADVERTLTVDLTAPTAPTYTAPASLKVGEAIAEMSPSGGIGIDQYAATGPAAGPRHRFQHRRDQRHAGRGGYEHRQRDRHGIGYRRQRRDRGHHVPGGGEGRPDAEWVRVQRLVGDVRSRTSHYHGPHRRADDAGLFGHARDGLYGERHHRSAHPGGRGRLRGHGHCGEHRRLQPGHGDIHGDGAGGGHAGVEREHHC